jgi:hypothetical protein
MEIMDGVFAENHYLDIVEKYINTVLTNDSEIKLLGDKISRLIENFLYGKMNDLQFIGVLANISNNLEIALNAEDENTESKPDGTVSLSNIFLPDLILSPHDWIYHGYDSRVATDIIELNPSTNLFSALIKIPGLADYLTEHSDEYQKFSLNVTELRYKDLMPFNFDFGNGITIICATSMTYANIETYRDLGYLSYKSALVYNNLFSLYRFIKNC